MIRRVYGALPGPTPVRVVVSVVLVAAALVVLHFFYEWLGSVLLDTGGTIE